MIMNRSRPTVEGAPWPELWTWDGSTSPPTSVRRRSSTCWWTHSPSSWWLTPMRFVRSSGRWPPARSPSIVAALACSTRTWRVKRTAGRMSAQAASGSRATFTRMVASVALLAWMKAISDADIASLIETYVQAYMEQVRYFVESDRDHEYALRLETTDGEIREILLETRLNTRIDLLDKLTLVNENVERRFRRSSGVRELEDAERARVHAAYEAYLETIPETKRFRSLTYQVKDIVGRQGFGIGSAGLPAYNVLVEGPTQALENDVVLSMKQGNVASPSRIVHDERIKGYFKHN